MSACFQIGRLAFFGWDHRVCKTGNAFFPILRSPRFGKTFHLPIQKKKAILNNPSQELTNSGTHCDAPDFQSQKRIAFTVGGQSAGLPQRLWQADSDPSLRNMTRDYPNVPAYRKCTFDLGLRFPGSVVPPPSYNRQLFWLPR